jgi:hypothetical protein
LRDSLATIFARGSSDLVPGTTYQWILIVGSTVIGMSSEAVVAAREAIHRRDRLAAEEVILTKQVDDADARVRELSARYYRERGDVVELEAITLKSVLARMTGSLDEKLAREQAEVDVARLQLVAQQQRHRALLQQRYQLRDEIAAFGDLNQALDRALASAASTLPPEDPRYAEAKALTTELSEVRTQAHVTERAMRTGRVALLAIEAVIGRLNTAMTLSGADMFAGALVSMAKVDVLEQARSLVVAAQPRIDEFVRVVGGADPGDVTTPDIDTRRFADVFLDNIFYDLNRHRRIERALADISRTGNWVHFRTGMLAQRAAELAARQATLERRRAQLVDDER